MATSNIGYNGGGTALDYTTIAAWEDATDGTLTEAQTGVLNYSDNAGSLVWTEAVNFIGATTTSSFYRTIRAAATLKHTGQEGTGVRWKSTTSTGDALYAEESYLRVQDIEFFDAGAAIDVNYWGNNIGLVVERCIFRDLAPPDGQAMLNLYQDSGQYTTIVVRNCLFYDNVAASGDSSGIRCRGSSSGTLEVYNCIFDQAHHGTYGCGITTAGAGTNTLTNVIATRSHGASGKDFDCGTSGTKTVTYCASEDATADDQGGSGNDISITPSDWYTDPDGSPPDYATKTASPGIDGGTSVSGFSDDLVGATRSGTWDQGCFEVVDSGQTLSGGAVSAAPAVAGGTFAPGGVNLEGAALSALLSVAAGAFSPGGVALEGTGVQASPSVAEGTFAAGGLTMDGAALGAAITVSEGVLDLGGQALAGSALSSSPAVAEGTFSPGGVALEGTAVQSPTTVAGGTFAPGGVSLEGASLDASMTVSGGSFFLATITLEGSALDATPSVAGGVFSPGGVSFAGSALSAAISVAEGVLSTVTLGTGIVSVREGILEPRSVRRAILTLHTKRDGVLRISSSKGGILGP